MSNEDNKEELEQLKEQALKDSETTKDLKEKLIEFEDIMMDHTENLEKLHRLYDLGVITKEGDIFNIEMSNKNYMIKEAQ